MQVAQGIVPVAIRQLGKCLLNRLRSRNVVAATFRLELRRAGFLLWLGIGETRHNIVRNVRLRAILEAERVADKLRLRNVKAVTL